MGWLGGVVPDWKPSAHQSLYITLLLSKGREKCNERLIGQDKGQRDHSPDTITDKADSTWGKY